MISYSLPWITTLYLQICSSGKQTLLTYTRESHWAKPLSSQTWTAPAKPRSGLVVLKLWLHRNRRRLLPGRAAADPRALTDSRGHGHLFKLQIKTSGCQGPGEGLSHRPARSNTNALGKRQPGPGHNHGSCAEKVGTMHGLGLRGANFQSGVVSLLV